MTVLLNSEIAKLAKNLDPFDEHVPGEVET